MIGTRVSAQRSIYYAFVFLSGFTALVYEVLWLKELRRLFGNTAQAAGTTLVAFFLGLTIGSYVCGKWARRFKNPLHFYSILEALIALSALSYFGLYRFYFSLYPGLFEYFSGSPFFFSFLKLLLASSLLFLPAFFMGGTIPALTQALPEKISHLYAWNVVGGTVGAFASGFFLPRWFGFQGSYLCAVGLNLALFITAFVASRNFSMPTTNTQKVEVKSELPLRLKNLAFLSGLVVMALEVLWTHMFALVTINSVYSFALVLIVFLTGLSCASFLLPLLRRFFRSKTIAFISILTGGILSGLTPLLFSISTDGLRPLSHISLWGELPFLFKTAMLVMFPSVLSLGILFPLLLDDLKRAELSSGNTMGRLSAINTLGAILGSFIAGFVCLEHFGIWSSISLFSAIYLFSLLWVTPEFLFQKMTLRALLIITLISTFVWMNQSLPISRVETASGERLLEDWQGSYGVVSAIENTPQNNRFIVVNNHYMLGGTYALTDERRQAQLPLLLHPAAKSVFFIGLATGITAGGALFYPVDRVVIAELIPQVITAARTYFGAFNQKLFEDPRVKMINEDGRNYLMATKERFDVIHVDLVRPWGMGAGDLFSKEHFESARKHLNPNGIFIQWFPTFELTEKQFYILAHTMNEVFPQVTLWRGNFNDRPILALIGQNETTPWSPKIVNINMSRMNPDALLEFLSGKKFSDFYLGNLTERHKLFEQSPIQTDNRPIIDYMAPIPKYLDVERKIPWLVGPRLDQMLTKIK